MSTFNKTRILLIEDNKADHKLIELTLDDASIKFDLLHAETLFEGLDIIQNKEIDLALLDLSLPDSSGFKTLSKFLEKAPHVPVILLTGMNNEIIGNQAIKAGAQDFLVKGQFDGKLLGRAIRYSLQRFKTQIKLEETARNLVISEKRFVEAQEMARFGNWEMDIVTSEMTWTDEIFRIFGFQPNSFTPTLSDYLSHVHTEDKSAVEAFFEVAAKDGQLHRLEHRIVLDNRNLHYVDIQAKVFYEEIDERILLVGAIQDITERKISEQLIIEKNLNNKTSKIKEAALSDIGFHIRTPLASIVNLLFLLDKSSTSNQQKEYLDGLKTSVDDLSMMVSNMLNFSMLASGDIAMSEEEINFESFFQSIKKVVQIKADNANINLSFDLAEGIPTKVKSDYNKLTQIFYNLFESIFGFTTSDSNINISVTSRELSDNRAMLTCIAKDTVNNISTDDLKTLQNAEKLLEVYTEDQDDDAEKKHLGAAIVSKLVNVMGGKIQIKSSADNGFEYVIDIPLNTVKANNFASGRPEMPIKILLVEDHFLNQIATKKVLTTWSEKITVDIAENGLVAVEKYREHGYDLILMDLQMPVMGGIEASRKIRDDSDVPIIALTANATNQEMEKCTVAGINDYLSKPFQPEELYSKILNLLVTVAG